jgi:hypothetical protein
MDAHRLFPWLVRLCWIVLPFTMGPALGAALHPHSEAVRLAAVALAWAAWAVVLVGTLVPYPLGLTALRVAAPGAAVVAVVAAATNRPSALDSALAVASALLALVVAMAPATGLLYVNGPAYPNERRYPLRPPGQVLMGPLELVWALSLGAPIVGILLLAARAWVAGAVVMVVSIPLAYALLRAMHGLSRRWVVFVPAGIVLHDPLTLVQPVLFQRAEIETLRAAPSDADALDLTMRAPGLALELTLRQTADLLLVKPGQFQGIAASASRLLVTPTRPGRVLQEAQSRHVRVG